MLDWTPRERDVLALLRDLRPYETAFGGAMPLDDTHVAEASYGPAGMVFRGQQYRKEDIVLLGRSLDKLRLALRILRHEDFDAWVSLIEPYLGDPADSGAVEDRRRKLAELDEENAAIRRENTRRIKKGRPAKPERVRLVFARQILERHDRAVKALAGYLKNEDLHVVNPRLMSNKEHGEMERQNAEVYALYQRLRVSGLKHAAACEQAAEMLGSGVSTDVVERLVEFKDDVKLVTCVEEGCENAVFSQNLCQKHYQGQWRANRREAKES